MHQPTRLARPLLPLLAIALAAAGCGDDDDQSETSDTAPTETSAPATDGAVEVVAVDYGYEGLPAEVDAGATLTLRSDSEQEVHELVAFALPEDEVRPAEELLGLPEEELGALFSGEPAMVLVAPPGEVGFPVVGDGTVTTPGRYLVFCAIPIGADPAEFLAAAQDPEGGPPDVAGGPPHFTGGMFAELTVR
jgi:hypothetical protein